MRVTFFVFLISVSASSWSECVPTDTLIQCLNKAGDASQAGQLISAKIPELSAAAVSASAAELALTNTGGTADADGVSLDDFNPLIAMSLASFSDADTSGGFTIAWSDFLQEFISNNFFDSGSRTSSGSHHKLVLTLEESDLYESLDQQIQDGDLKKELSDSIDEFDNVSFELRYAPPILSEGRSLSTYSGWIDLIQGSARAKTLNDLNKLHQSANDRMNIIRRFDIRDQNTPLDQLLGSEDAQKLADQVNSTSLVVDAYTDLWRLEMDGAGLSNLQKLVNNQSQFVFTAKGNRRDELVGPDEYSAKVSVELGAVNISTMDKVCNTSADKLACMNKFVADNGTAIERGHRFSASLEYSRREEYEFSRDDFQLELDDSSSWVAQLSYSRKLNLGLHGLGLHEPAQFDLSGSYEDVDDDPMRQDRALAKISLTQGLTDGFFLSLSLNWANKSEFRGDVDRELSAKAGLTYKLARQ